MFPDLTKAFAQIQAWFATWTNATNEQMSEQKAQTVLLNSLLVEQRETNKMLHGLIKERNDG